MTVHVCASTAQSTFAFSKTFLCHRHAVHAIAALLHAVPLALLNPCIAFRAVLRL